MFFPSGSACPGCLQLQKRVGDAVFVASGKEAELFYPATVATLTATSLTVRFGPEFKVGRTSLYREFRGKLSHNPCSSVGRSHSSLPVGSNYSGCTKKAIQ